MINKFFISVLSLILLFGPLAKSQNPDLPRIRAEAKKSFLVDADQMTDFDLYIDAQHSDNWGDENYNNPATSGIDFEALDYDNNFPTEHLRMLVELSQAYAMLTYPDDDDPYPTFSMDHTPQELANAIVSGLDWWFQHVHHGVT